MKKQAKLVHLALKLGHLGEYRFEPYNAPHALFTRYLRAPLMRTRYGLLVPGEEGRELLCELIDECEGPISVWGEPEPVSKDEAKAYVNESPNLVGPLTVPVLDEDEQWLQDQYARLDAEADEMDDPSDPNDNEA